MPMIRNLALLAAVAFLMGAEKSEPEPKPAAPPKADIRGVASNVAALKGAAAIGRMSVDGKKEKDTGYDRAAVTVLAKAKVYHWKGGKKVAAKFADVVNGCVVQCVFEGPVRESYPVQAGASEVLILSTPKKK